MNMQALQVPLGKEGADKTARSIFVGNIPYEATEEKLVELFSQAGPVLSFRLVYDRESGKPKGYGFCEYNSPAIAASALRNLNDIAFNGRPLRIGPAAGEQNSAEIALTNPSVGPPLENPYGNAVDPTKAPEAISRAVASLPPEQMYELMKQMKLCIQNNPNEARNMLLQNPQLAYALLQAQIVMKIVDPKVAIAMLNRSHDQIPPARPDNSGPSQSQSAGDNVPTSGPEMIIPQQAPMAPMPSNNGQFMSQPPFSNDHRPPPVQPEPMPPSMGLPPAMYHQGFQPPPSNQGPALPPFHHHHHQSHHPLHPPTSMGAGPPPPFGPPPGQPPHGLPSLDQMNPAIAAAAAMMGAGGPPSAAAVASGLPQKEQEKVELIMQVLSLSEEAIEMLPEDQQRSIRVLKEQVRKTGVF